MKKCIYTLCDEAQAKFESGEHIIPRCIGGSVKLDKEWVSEDFNNKISKAEREFARMYPLITLPRMMDGPTGRKEHHGRMGVGFLKIRGTDQLQLGYIDEGVPRTIWQLIAPMDALEQNLIKNISCIVEKNGEELQLIEKLAKYEGEIIIVKARKTDFGRDIAVGWINKQVYAGVSSDIDKEVAEQFARKLLQLVCDGKLQQANKASAKEKCQVEYQGKTAFSISEIDRVYAKIAFNVLANIKGQKFVLRSEFDCIRNAIVTGEGITEQVSMPNAGPSQDIAKHLKLSKDEHLILLQQEDDQLIGVVNLYGRKGASVMIRLSTSWIEPFDATGYICDWKNKKEQTIEEYIKDNFKCITNQCI